MKRLLILPNIALLTAVLLWISSCNQPKPASEAPVQNQPFVWENATVYFMLTDRFYNGDTTNDFSFGRKADAAPYRGFMGGDIRGVIQKLEEGYFDDLGVSVLWMTPVFEQIKGAVDEGHGTNYGFHGYWMRDWTTLDPNFGTLDDLQELIKKARARDIKILFDVVLNHTGPVTAQDTQWPDNWVRTSPTCTYQDYQSTTQCTLVENLPDIKTESDEPVELPDFLLEKWEKEGRLEAELASLDAFFEKTGHPRAARFYIMKWLVDYIEKMGIDGFRVDTVKHVEESVWEELYALAVEALKKWKSENPAEKKDDLPFHMLGEVYNFHITPERLFSFDGGEKDVDYFDKGFQSMINFSFKSDVNLSANDIFTKYDQLLNSPAWQGLTVLNYISSHDDGDVPDRERRNIRESGTKLLLSPGMAQIYYGDESGRKLTAPGATGDATLRSMMNWEEIEEDPATQQILTHWQKIGRFRKNHPAIGAGKHQVLQDQMPYAFSRQFASAELVDQVVVIMNAEKGQILNLNGLFADGATLRDAYTGDAFVVKNNSIEIKYDAELVLLEETVRG